MAKSKNEIDKELMYKKLMPSAGKFGAESEPIHIEDDDIKAATELLDKPLVHHATAVSRQTGVPFMDNQPTILVNVMENIVLEKLESVLSRFKCCKCDRCKKDIVALSLNKLPPKYMVIVEGQPTPDIDTQTNAQVITAMIQAVLAVREKPRH
ncbi:MAG: late competence development ComFB family protein [Clostridiales bacterium]|nr:late competence development ComFB family protein [Clostridiales bacterium]